MPQEMRMIDAESFEEKLRPLLRVSQKKRDERAEATLTYVLELLAAEPSVDREEEKAGRPADENDWFAITRKKIYGEYADRIYGAETADLLFGKDRKGTRMRMEVRYD